MKFNSIFILLLVILMAAFSVRFFVKKEEPKTSVFVDSGAPIASGTPVSSPVNVEGTPAVQPSVSFETLSAPEKAQLQILSEIFKTKNDNDPRMDKELKNLSPAVKAALRQQYAATKDELRNEKGTIAFLIGRELKDGRGTAEDVQFLKSVLMEKPCLSLADCSKSPSGVGPEEQHLEAIHETTANYPQLMDLRYLEQALEGGNLSAELRNEVLAALDAARNSPNPRVAQDAQSILDRFQRR